MAVTNVKLHMKQTSTKINQITHQIALFFWGGDDENIQNYVSNVGHLKGLSANNNNNSEDL